MKKKEDFELFSDTYAVNKELEFIKDNNKLYSRIINTLKVLGNFKGKINVDIYDKDKDNTRLWFSNSNKDIFVIYSHSNDKNNYNLISYEGNNSYTYDVSLIKKAEITKDNINMMRVGKIKTFKFGRLITDEKKFYNIYLGDGISFGIDIDNSSGKIYVDDLVNELNKVDNSPRLFEISNIFHKIITDKSISYDNVLFTCYKDYQIIGKIDSNNIEKNKQI